MKNIKKIVSIALISSLAISIVGCSNTETEVDKVEKPSKVIEKAKALDAENREIEKPQMLDKIAVTCYGGATHELVVLGAGDKIIAQPSMDKFQQLLKMNPSFKDILDPGSFDDVNVEELLKVSPDMAFVGITSKDGNELIENAGIPTFTMLIGSADIDRLKKEFEMVGIMLGNEQRATDLIKYWDEKLGVVKDMVSKVPEKDRKKVYYAGENITTASSGVWGDSFIVESGGVNVTSSLAKGAKGSEISVEQVLDWNPDVIITQKREQGVSSFKEDERIKDLNAIKNDAIYQCPIGGFWWDRPSPESPLGFMWLASELYPEYTKDINLEKETKEFYKQFYNYELTDEEYKSFF